MEYIHRYKHTRNRYYNDHKFVINKKKMISMLLVFTNLLSAAKV